MQGTAEPVLWRHRADTRRMLATEPPEPDWVLPGLEVGRVGLMGGPGGVGASFLALEASASVAAGRDLFGALGGEPRPGTVLHVVRDDPEPVLARRLHALAAQSNRDAFEAAIERLHIVSLHGRADALARWMTGDEAFTKGAITELALGVRDFQPRLLVVDAVARNLVNYDTVGRLQALATAQGCAVLALHRGDGLPGGLPRWTLRGMTPEERLLRGMDEGEEHRWVKVSGPPPALGSSGTETWLRRTEEGVLVPGTPPPVTGRLLAPPSWR